MNMPSDDSLNINRFRHISELFSIVNSGVRRTYTVLQDVAEIRSGVTREMNIVSNDIEKFPLSFPVARTKCRAMYNVNCVDGDIVSVYTISIRTVGSGDVSINFDQELIARSTMDKATKIYTPDDELLALYILSRKFDQIECNKWEMNLIRRFFCKRTLFR